MKTPLVFLLWLACCGSTLGQTQQPDNLARATQTNAAPSRDASKTSSALEPLREKRALQTLLQSVQKQIVSAADAMPADKYGFVPTDGEFKGVRTFGQQLKHLSATNHILAAAALGEHPPVDAGDETGPENVRTKAEILAYLNTSFAHLDSAISAIGEKNFPASQSPISPLPAAASTRLAFIVEALIHAIDHYGQMVIYLRMNGVVPPASRT